MRRCIGAGWIGPVHLAGREVLRRIFVTVRDRNWQETPPTQFEHELDEHARTVRMRARHTSELVDFEWRGELVLEESACRLRFAFEGRALRDMHVCRLGLVVLHPVESMVGARITVADSHFEQSRTVGRVLAPQPIVEGIPGAVTEPFTRLSIERMNWGQLLLTFNGDSFELEDQRNWGDASFKTYCTPLRRGFPRLVKQGTSIAHSVELRFTPPERTASSVANTTGAEAVTRLAQLPEIGRVWHATAEHDSMRGVQTKWDHLHVDLVGQELAALRRLLAFPAAGRLEIAVDAAIPAGAMSEWSAYLRNHRERIARLLLYGPGTCLPSRQSIEAWQEALDGATAGQGIPLFAATRGYFVEINRAVPVVAATTGVAFPLTATVHSDDADTLMSNVSAVRDMIGTARHLMPGSAVALAPLALYYPPAATRGGLPGDVVTRWFAATASNAAAAGVSSITLAEDLLDVLRAQAGMCSAEAIANLITSQRHSARAGAGSTP
ncbi:MAG TPA: hypothetical protein VFO35_01560 [Steroidobacteraceae bacterium]|nr:hypothetical protein [Steroidobacteraceae bacterium]